MRIVSSLSATLSQLLVQFIAFFKGSRLRRQLLACALVFSLLILPIHASAFSGAFALASDTLRAALFPVRILPTRLAGWFTTKKPPARAETLAERANRVSHLRLSPAKYVGYVNQQMTFAALPSDVYGEAVPGARLSWDSSDQTTVSMDGRATFLKPGLAWLICRVGVAESRVPVLVRPGQRPPQSVCRLAAATRRAMPTTATSACLR